MQAWSRLMRGGDGDVGEAGVDESLLELSE